MRYARIILIASIGCLFALLFGIARAEDKETVNVDAEAVRAVAEKARQAAADFELPVNKHLDSAKGKAREMVDVIYSAEYQNKVRTETERLKKTIFGPQFQSDLAKQAEKQYVNQTVKGKLAGNERLYIFISSSVPMHVLRNYAADAGRLQDPNIIFVLRGFVGGARYVKPTKTFVLDMLKRSPDCDASASVCEALGVSLQIDPALFARYGISEVPAFVYVPDIQIVDFDRSEGESDSAKVGTYIMIKGDMPLENMLEKLQEETGSRTVASVLTALRSGFFN